MRFALFALLLVAFVVVSQQTPWEEEGFLPAKNDMIVGTYVNRFRRDASSSSSSEESKEKESEQEGSGEGSGSEEEKSRERRESESSGEVPESRRFKREVEEGSGEVVLQRMQHASLEADVAEASGDVEGSGVFFI